MNVAFDPWIPVVMINGERRMVSLQDVFLKGKEIPDLSVRPHERVSLMRLFICVAYAALNGPKDNADWRSVPNKIEHSVSEYLKKWKDSFELFHPTKPWLQIADLKPPSTGNKKSTSINKLDFYLGLKLVNHFQEDYSKPLTNEQLTLGLLTLQNFSTCGLLSIVAWNGIETAKSANDAPCITSSMYHLFLLGPDLLTTICINLCDFYKLSFRYNMGDNWLGRPIWESSSITATATAQTSQFLSRLVPLSRAVLLEEKSLSMLYGEALQYPSFPDFPNEFNTSVMTTKSDTRILVGAKIKTRPWRQLDSILQYNQQGNTISHALNLDNFNGESIDLWVGALLRNPGKQDILDTVESRFHISKELRTPNGCSLYSTEVEFATDIFNALNAAIRLYRSNLDPSNNTGIGSSASIHYWTSVENNLSLLMSCIESLGSDNFIFTQKKWREMLFASVHDSYRTACGKGTPRQMKAFTQGLNKLNYDLGMLCNSHNGA